MGIYWDPNKVKSGVFELSNNNKVATAIDDDTDQSAIGELAALDHVYFEIEVITASFFEVIAICNPSHLCSQRAGFTDNSWGWMAIGRLYHDSTYSGTVGFSRGDVLMVALVSGKVWFGKNGTWIESGDPANGSNPCFEDADITGSIFSCFGNRYNNDSAQLRMLSGEFSYTPPTGFGAMGEMYKVAGSVFEAGAGVQRTVRAYSRSSGALLGETVSGTDGSFSIDTLSINEEVYVVALDDTGDVTDYNALIYDRIVPVAA